MIETKIMIINIALKKVWVVAKANSNESLKKLRKLSKIESFKNLITIKGKDSKSRTSSLIM